MRPLWMKAVLALAGVWLIVWGTVWLARESKPTPEKLRAYVAGHSLEGTSGKERGRIIEKVEDQLNGLTYEERQHARMGKSLDLFFRSLTPDEQAGFLDRTLPAGMKQMMDALNKMAPAKRKEFVDRALADMKKHEGDAPPQSDDPNVQKIVQQGLRSFYSDASADVKLDFSPLIEQMQKNLQSFR